MTLILDGKLISNQIKAELKEECAKLKLNNQKMPTLALLLVGEDAASQTYVNSKHKTCLELGYESITKRVGSDISQEEVIDIIQEWNNDFQIDGILVQLPLPRHIDENKILLTINPDKDIDGFHPINVGKLVAGMPAFAPCTPYGIMELLERYNIDISGMHAVVVGRSNIVGKPITNMLYQKKKFANATVTICHTGTKDMSYHTKQADILIVAMGSPMAIKAVDIKDGAIVIDVGINRIDADNEKGYRIVGDVDFEDVKQKCKAITPVPGGIGAMTIAMLMKNTMNALKMKLSI